MKKALLIICIFLLVFIAYFVTKGLTFYRGITNGVLNKTPVVEKTAYNILLLGYGGPGHDGPYLTDSMMVLHVDLDANKIVLISLPRDLWVGLPTKSNIDFHSKINTIYQMGLFPKDYPDVDTTTYPDGALVKKAVQTATGLTIDNFVAIDFTGFEKGIDILGGVDVQVIKAFDDYGYPIDGKENDLCGRDADFAQIEKFLKPGFSENEKTQLFKDKPDLETFYNNVLKDPPSDAFPCRYEHLHFDAGLVHMGGATALKYVRSRHSLQDGTDFGRGARQQQFVKSVKDKVINLGIITKIGPLLDELQNHIKTDISVSETKKFIGETKDAASYRLINIRMSDSDYLKAGYSDYGGYILNPRTGQDNWNEIHTMIQNGIMEITPTPTSRSIPPTPSSQLEK